MNGERSRTHKVFSDLTDPSRPVALGIERIAADFGIAEPSFLQSCDIIVHGTTVATNALIQGTGAKTGLLCTQGFRNSLEIRQGYKEERYDLSYGPPPMLVPRYLRRAIRERIGSDGQILEELDEAHVREQIAYLKAEEVEAVAVSLLWSFINPAHERRIGELLRENFPAAYHSLSVDILPQIREYDRTSTTVVNAYVGPILERYVQLIKEVFAQKGAPEARIRFMQCNAGIASAEALLKRPLYALHSGPAAGPPAGLYFGQRVGNNNIIVADMGGTSFDVSLAHNGLPDTAKGIDVCRYRVGIPMINVHSVGSGGGSIAWLDRGGLLHVGPRSAQAIPGPVAYRRGGIEPTVTDANIVLGYLATLGDYLDLDSSGAAEAVKTYIARPTGLTVDAAAHGIFEVVNHDMAMAIRECTVERGYDPREFALIVGGGACAIHAGRIVEELGVSSVVIPKVASTLCAFGEVVADLRHDHVSSFAVPTSLRKLDTDRLNTILMQLEQEGRDKLEREGVPAEAVSVVRTLDMRYAGQIHECDVSIDDTSITSETIHCIEDAFHQRHTELYTYANRSGIPELVSVGVSVRGRHGAPVELAQSIQTKDLAEARRQVREIYLPARGYVPTPVYDGDRFPVDRQADGPCIIEEASTTIVVFPGWRITLASGGFYLMSRADSIS